MRRKAWGLADKRQVELFTLGKPGGLQLEITNFGGAIVSLFVPDRRGQITDVVLGYDSLEGYQECTKSFGVIVGRHANRIAGASFTLEGVTYHLAANDGANHIHGGIKGLSKVVWEPRATQIRGNEALELSYFSPHNEEGYPGNLQVRVTYSLIAERGVRIDYWAQADKDTVVNLTNHSYFNLAGAGQGLILDHKLQLPAEFFTPIDAESLPTGEICKVDGTPFDFRTKMCIGKRIDEEHEQIKAGQGYDHNWLVPQKQKGLNMAARVEHTPSGRVLEVWTTKPGVQFYSGNFLDGVQKGKGGISYPRRSGFCLETQYFPNSLRFPHFPSALLQAGKTYESTTLYQFSLLE